jgi:uncharacterized protein YndB with AHSA1/START domain
VGISECVAIHNVLVRARPEQVWAVLADGWAYADWVVGTKAIRAVDDGWPAPGTSIHFTAGAGPVTLEDRTTVRIAEPAKRLELEIRAKALGTARLSIEILPWAEDAVVVLDEHPLTGAGAAWHNLVVDAMLRVRNRRMLKAFARVVESRFPR